MVFITFDFSFSQLCFFAVSFRFTFDGLLSLDDFKAASLELKLFMLRSDKSRVFIRVNAQVQLSSVGVVTVMLNMKKYNWIIVGCGI